MLASVGQVGRVGIGQPSAATGGFSLEHINVLGRGGIVFVVQLSARSFNGLMHSVKRWAENVSNAHFLLTPGYIAGLLSAFNASGAVINMIEPIEVKNVIGADFYISKAALGSSATQHQVIV